MTVHEEDKEILTEAVTALVKTLDPEEHHPSLREKVRILVELVYVKGRARGCEECTPGLKGSKGAN